MKDENIRDESHTVIRERSSYLLGFNLKHNYSKLFPSVFSTNIKIDAKLSQQTSCTNSTNSLRFQDKYSLNEIQISV